MVSGPGPIVYLRLACNECTAIFTIRAEQTGRGVNYCPACGAARAYISQLEPDESWVESQAHKYGLTVEQVELAYKAFQQTRGMSWQYLLTGKEVR